MCVFIQYGCKNPIFIFTLKMKVFYELRTDLFHSKNESFFYELRTDPKYGNPGRFMLYISYIYIVVIGTYFGFYSVSVPDHWLNSSLMTSNENINISSFKSIRNIQKKEGGLRHMFRIFNSFQCT